MAKPTIHHKRNSSVNKLSSKYFGKVIIVNGNFASSLENVFSELYQKAGSPSQMAFLVVGWYSGASNVPTGIPSSGGIFIAVYGKGLSNRIYIVEVNTLGKATISFSAS